MARDVILGETIALNFPPLTKKHKVIARFVLDNCYFVAWASANREDIEEEELALQEAAPGHWVACRFIG